MKPFLLVAVGALLLFAVAAYAQTTDTLLVNVTITSVSEVTIFPFNMTFSSLSPRDVTAAQQFIIKNTGSANLSNIYLSGNTFAQEYPTNPLTGTNPSLYSSTGFIQVQNETTATTHFVFVNRLEWNLTQNLQYETLNLVGSGANLNWSHGWFRNNSNNYLWKLENGTDGMCNTTGTVLTVKTTPENSTNGAQRDLSTGTVTPSQESTGTNWSVFTPTSGPFADYCVAAFWNCTRIMIYKYDPVTFPTCANAAYFRYGQLVPGNETKSSLARASIPEGIPASTALSSPQQGTITFTAT